MHKLNRKILTVMATLLILILVANSYMLYKAINRYERNAIRRENAELADKISNLFMENPNLVNARFVKNIFDINGIQGAVNTENQGVIFSNLEGIKIKDILLRPDLVGARSEITGPNSKVIGQVFIVERDTSRTRIQAIFKLSVTFSAFFGIVLMSVLSVYLYRKVSKPLNQIIKNIESDQYVNIKDDAWAPLIKTHNQSKESRSKFLEEASHAMKAPLMNIQGSVEAFEDGIFSQTEMSAKITGEVQRLKESVDQMIRSSKAETFIFNPNAFQQIDVQEFLEDHLPVLPQFLHITLNIENVPFFYDPKVLQIILENLLQNAMRYAKKQITITYKCDRYHTFITVEDDGDGIDPSIQNSLFERFSKGTGGKTGLGLSIVKSYVSLTGGSIRYEKRDGACFEMKWPKTLSSKSN